MEVDFHKVDDEHYQITYQSDDITRGSYEWVERTEDLYVASSSCPQFFYSTIYLRGLGRTQDNRVIKVNEERFLHILKTWVINTGAVVKIDGQLLDVSNYTICIGGL